MPQGRVGIWGRSGWQSLASRAESGRKGLRALPDRGIPRLKVISLDMPPFFSILGSRAGTVRNWI
jgi:hypothetical protein